MQIESYGSAGPLSAHACKWNGAGRTRRVLSGDAARGHGWIYTRTVGSGKGWMRITSRETGMSWGIGRCGSGLGWKANWGNEKWEGNEWVGEELGYDECWMRMNKCPIQRPNRRKSEGKKRMQQHVLMTARTGKKLKWILKLLTHFHSQISRHVHWK